jgi:RNA polymerase sigma-70 factor (ECF subfamily)
MERTSGSHTTSPTLLGRMAHQPADQAAWQEFIERYGRKIYGWCRQRQLQDCDAEDVTQAVLVKLAGQMRTFAYDPSRSFRGWLRTLTQHAWSDFVTARQRAGRGSGDSAAQACLHSALARDDLVRRLEEEFDHEVLQEATARVRLRVTPQSWEAFRLTTIDGLAGADAARQLGMGVAAVFKAKGRVQKLLQEETRRLEGEQP